MGTLILGTMTSSPDIARGRSKDARRRLLACAAAYALMMAAIIWAGNVWADERASSQGVRLAQDDAASRASLLISELQKYRLIPIVLGEYPDVHTTLAAPDNAAARRLDDKLAQLARMIGSSAIYLLDGNGRTIAASNARLPTSFVGQNYAFRPYFTVAKARGTAEFFGLGTVSGQPGLYLARRVCNSADCGVIVVKFGFEAVEGGWASANEPAYVTDEKGVVLITNRPGWRFRTTRLLPDAELAELRRTRQFGSGTLAPLPIKPSQRGLVALSRRGAPREIYAATYTAVPVTGWTLTTLEPIRPLRSQFLATARLAIVAFAIILIVPIFLWLRARERTDLAAIARVELEEQVALRTEQLESTQIRFREAREELAHASRLGSIGQITAAVAHEINQPTGAIRAFAENGRQLLERGDYEGAMTNLDLIAQLTVRIGAIIAELRTYARRGSGEMRATALDNAVDGALLFIGHRLRSAGITFERHGDSVIKVHADPLRLEQILVNLLHNAIEALTDVKNPRILLIVRDDGDFVELDLADTGCGIPERLAGTLFTPFATSKSEGLGLGLGIARDIAREFGGELDLVEARPPWRTCFRLTLKRA